MDLLETEEEAKFSKYFRHGHGETAAYIDKAGYLQKHCPNARIKKFRWQKRWCVLNASSIFSYFKTHKDPDRRKAPAGSFDMCDFRVYKVDSGEGSKKRLLIRFDAYDEDEAVRESFQFAVPSEEERVEWIKTILALSSGYAAAEKVAGGPDDFSAGDGGSSASSTSSVIEHYAASSSVARSDQVHVVFLGDQCVGKTHIAQKIANGASPTEYFPTLEDNYSFTHRGARIELTDTSGLGVYGKTPTEHAFENDIAIVVYSITSKPSFERAAAILADIREVRMEMPILVVANMLDRAMDDRMVETAEGADLAATRNAAFLEVSALRDDDLKDRVSTAMLSLTGADDA